MTVFLFFPKGYGVGAARGLRRLAAGVGPAVSVLPLGRAVKARRRDWWLSYL